MAKDGGPNGVDEDLVKLAVESLFVAVPEGSSFAVIILDRTQGEDNFQISGSMSHQVFPRFIAHSLHVLLHQLEKDMVTREFDLVGSSRRPN